MANIWFPFLSLICKDWSWVSYHVKLRVVHLPGMPGTSSPPPTSTETATWRPRHASRHVRHARVVMHVWIAYPRWRGKRFRYSRGMRNPQFYVSGKRPVAWFNHGAHDIDSFRIRYPAPKSRCIEGNDCIGPVKKRRGLVELVYSQ